MNRSCLRTGCSRKCIFGPSAEEVTDSQIVYLQCEVLNNYVTYETAINNQIREGEEVGGVGGVGSLQKKSLIAARKNRKPSAVIFPLVHFHSATD